MNRSDNEQIFRRRSASGSAQNDSRAPSPSPELFVKNHFLCRGIFYIFLLTNPAHSDIITSAVREMVFLGGKNPLFSGIVSFLPRSSTGRTFWQGDRKSHGRMAQLVEPTGQVIKLPVHEYLK